LVILAIRMFWIEILPIPSIDHYLATYRDNAIYDFSKKAVENGLDIFRVFDALNYIGQSGVCAIMHRSPLTSCLSLCRECSVFIFLIWERWLKTNRIFDR
jgi:hypothetical protein